MNNIKCYDSALWVEMQLENELINLSKSLRVKPPHSFTWSFFFNLSSLTVNRFSSFLSFNKSKELKKEIDQLFVEVINNDNDLNYNQSNEFDLALLVFHVISLVDIVISYFPIDDNEEDLKAYIQCIKWEIEDWIENSEEIENYDTHP